MRPQIASSIFIEQLSNPRLRNVHIVYLADQDLNHSSDLALLTQLSFKIRPSRFSGILYFLPKPRFDNRDLPTRGAVKLNKMSYKKISSLNQEKKTETEILPVEDLESQIPQLLDQLRDLLKEYPECRRRDDEFLCKFLRVRDYNVQRALVSVRAFYLHTARFHHILDGIRPDQFRAVFDARIACVLSSRCPQGSRVGVFRLEAWDPSKFSLLQILQATILQFHQFIEDKKNQLGGATIIFDFKGLSLSHARQLTPRYIRGIAFAGQEGLPISLAGLHFINHPYLFWGTYYIARGFMKPKLRKRIHFHQNVESLQRHFGKEILPSELGGILDMDEVVDKQLTENLLLRNREYSYYY